MALNGTVDPMYLRGTGLAAWLLVNFAVAQEVSIDTNIAQQYRAGVEDALTINLHIENSETLPREAVLFLSVIRLLNSGGYVQATHKIFANANTEPNIFRTVLTNEDLQAGIKAQVNFQLRNRIKPGKYALVLQLFSGSNTNPHRVNVNERIAMQVFHFKIVNQ